jgi:hypothetical protein
MCNRVLAAVCAGALGASVLTVPVESAARGGVAGGFRGAGAFHPSFVRPHSFVPPHSAAAPHAAVRSHVAVPRGAAVPPNASVKPFLPARAAFTRRHRGFANRGRFWYGGLAYTDGIVGPFYGSYYDPSDYAYYNPSDYAYYNPAIVGSLRPAAVSPSVYHALGAYPVSAAAPAAQPVRYGCRSEIVTVSASSDDKNDVTIVRC